MGIIEANKQLVGQLNLLSAEIIREQKLDKIRKLISCFLLLIITLLVVIKIQSQHKIDRLQEELATVNQPATQIQTLQREAEIFRTKLDHEEKRENLLSNQNTINPASDLSHIETITPASIKLLRINLSLDNLSLSGQATKPQDIACFLEQLQHCYGNSIRLITCQLKDNSKYYFQIEGKKLAL